VRFNKSQRLLLDYLGCIHGFMAQVIAIEYDFLGIVPQMGGVVPVRLALAVIAKKNVKALFVRRTAGAYHAQSPFAERARAVPCRLQQLCKRLYGVGKRVLPFRLDFFIAAYIGMSGVLAGQ